MARLKMLEGSISAVETIRKRLDRTMEQFSEDLGYGKSAYAQMVRDNKVTKTVALAAEALMRRQAPGTEAEIAFVVRIVRGMPLVTALDELQSMTLGDQRYLLLPAEMPQVKAAARASNGAELVPVTVHVAAPFGVAHSIGDPS